MPRIPRPDRSPVSSLRRRRALALAAFLAGAAWIATGTPNPQAAELRDEPVPHASKDVRGHWATSRDGYRIWFETEGTGVPIFLIAGGPGGAHNTFHLTHARLARHGMVVYIDNRGRGRSDRGKGNEPYSLENDLRDVEAVREALGADRIVLYGRSYGGMVAQAYAIEHPTHVRALILSNTLDGAQSWQKYNIEGVKLYLSTQHPDQWDEIVKLHDGGYRTGQDTLANLFDNLGEMYNYDPDNDSLFRAQARRFFEPGVPGFSLEVYKGMTGPDAEWTIGGPLGRVELAPRLGRITAPTLVLAGRYDRITPPVVQRKIARAIPGARIVDFERSGHRPEFEEADLWNTVMDEFLTRALSDVDPVRTGAGSR